MKCCEIRWELRVSPWAIFRVVLLDGKFFCFLNIHCSCIFFVLFFLSVCYCGISDILLSKFPEM